MPEIILGICGRPRCGKTTFSNHLSKEYGAERFYAISGVVSSLTADLGREPSRTEIDQRVAVLREERSNFSVVAETLPLVVQSKAPVVIVDSLKFMDDLFALRQYPDACLVAITAPDEVRTLNRQRGGDKQSEVALTAEEAKRIEASCYTESQMDALLAHADFTVANTGDEGFLRAIDNLMHRIHVQHRPFLPAVTSKSPTFVQI